MTDHHSLLNIAVFFGGCSPEYGVSLESASAVLQAIDRAKYTPVMIGITRTGDWFYYTGPVERIKNDTWYTEDLCVPAVLSPCRSRHELLLLRSKNTCAIPIDAALPMLHGKNGEDGTLQGLLELSGIPLAGCGTLASALCMDKDRSHKLVSLAGIRVPQSLTIQTNSEETLQQCKAFADDVGFPVFVKPVKAGSSFGITRALSPAALCEAITLAFSYDDTVILEEAIDGFEVGCAVLGPGHDASLLLLGEVDEITLSEGFFDFTEKYTLKTSSIHVPARISVQKSEEIKKTAAKIYQVLGCSGFARVDLFLTPSGQIVFNEVNTIPGFTSHSRYPGMMKAAGYSFEEILNRILQQATETR